MSNTGWECPKCGRVWSPTTYQCWTCNGDGNERMPSSPTDASQNPPKPESISTMGGTREEELLEKMRVMLREDQND